MSIKEQLSDLHSSIPAGVTLVAVSKTHDNNAIMQAYQAGQRIFGESRVQELCAKYDSLPKDIQWHMIGHLQTNKVRFIAPFIEMIHSVDSEKLLIEIQKQAAKCSRTIDVLLEIHIAGEESKSGWLEQELCNYLSLGEWRQFTNVRIRGLMGIASNTEDISLVKDEFHALKALFDNLKTNIFDADFDTLSMGMTHDHRQAIECGSNMVRIGSMIFGMRNFNI